MQANKKNREKCQRRSLRIEKFEHRIVPAASIVPVEAIQVDVEPLQPAIEFRQQEGQGAKLRDGKGPGIWTARGTSGVTDTLGRDGCSYMTTDSFLDGHAEEKPTVRTAAGDKVGAESIIKAPVLEDAVSSLLETDQESNVTGATTLNIAVEKLKPAVNDLWHDAGEEEIPVVASASENANGITFPDDLGPPGIWTDGTINNVIEKLAPTVNDLWHDAGEEEIPVVASASENVNGITVPDDWGPPGIWTTGPVSSIVEQLIPAGLTDLAKPNALTAGVIDKQRPPGLVDMAKPTRATSGVVEKLAPAVDQIFHDAGEPDIPRDLPARVTGFLTQHNALATGSTPGENPAENVGNYSLVGDYSGNGYPISRPAGDGGSVRQRGTPQFG